MGQSMREAALQFASYGIPVVPLHTPGPEGCSCRDPECGSPGKHPRRHPRDLPHGVRNASADPAQIDRWWGRWPEANIGIATGSRSGIVVVDLDGPEGVESARKVLPPHALQETLAVQTGNGGYHLYYHHEGEAVPNSVKRLAGVDVRGDGGYVVAPPSRHYSGRNYEWATATAFNALPPIPEALGEALLGPASSNGRLAAEEWGHVLYEGERDQEITRRAGKLLGADIPAHIVLKTLTELNEELCDPPLPEADIIRIVESIDRKELAKQAIQEKRKKSETVTDFPLLPWAEALRRYGGFEVEWTVDDWLPEATVGMVVAPPGSYKTWMLADLCLAVAGARPFLGEHTVERPGPVIIIQQEDFLPMLMDRMCKMLGAGLPTEDEDGTISLPVYGDHYPVYIHDKRLLHFGDAAVVRGLRKRIEELRPSLIMLDPLYSAVGMADYMAEAAQQMMVLKQLRDDYGCSFMIAHHTTKKRGEGRERDSAWGSQFLNAWLETGWQLREGGAPNNVSVVRHFKVSPDAPPIQLEFIIDDYSYSVRVNDDPADPSNMREAAATLIRDGKISSVGDLQEIFKMAGKGAISRILQELGARKQGGRYVLPPDFEVEDD
jgi:hypothetical protein